MATRITEFERDGLIFDVLDEGPEDGTPVILLHGFPERATCWRLVAPLLHEAGFRTFAPDQRGYSPRARPRKVRAYAATELAADAARLADLVAEETGQRPHLVGHDWGSAVAWATAISQPASIASLTAFSVPHPGAFLKSEVTSTQFLKSWYFIPLTLPFFTTAAAKRRGLIGPSLTASGMTTDDVDRFMREISAYGCFPYAVNWYRAMVFSNRKALGARVGVPTTMVWSDGDTAVGRHGVDRSGDYVDADYRLVVLEGVSHWIPTQAPQDAAAAIIDRVRRA